MDARFREPRIAHVARTAWLVLGTLMAVLAALLATLAPRDARAQDAASASVAEPSLQEQIRHLAAAPGATPDRRIARVEVVVGTLDPRLHLAPCQRIEPYLPTGVRPWGKTRVGLRCTQGASPWNVYLPVTVRAWGRGLVAASTLGAGSTLQTGDVVEGEVDYAESASPPLQDAAQAVGRTLAQPVKPGQSVRVAHLRARQWFAAGDTVRLVAGGAGFRLESEGQALSNGVEGQSARVRTDSGRIVTGSPVGARLVELSL